MPAIIQEELGSYKGFIAENFVAQELFSKINHELYSWNAAKGEAEVEFLVIQDSEIVLIEVKSSRKSRKAKSLIAYCEKYTPSLAIKLTGRKIGWGGVGKG